MTPAQCKAARALIDFNQKKLADASGVGLSTVVDFEKNRRVVSSSSVSALEAALEKAGVTFLPENGGGVGVRLSKP